MRWDVPIYYIDITSPTQSGSRSGQKQRSPYGRNYPSWYRQRPPVHPANTFLPYHIPPATSLESQPTMFEPTCVFNRKEGAQTVEKAWTHQSRQRFQQDETINLEAVAIKKHLDNPDFWEPFVDWHGFKVQTQRQLSMSAAFSSNQSHGLSPTATMHARL